jgi:SpoVK/Ycf46/Vps4 family AAA+-type ATPase
MSLLQETNDLFNQVDEAILDLKVLQAETSETMELVNNLLSKITENMKILDPKELEPKKIIINDKVDNLCDLLDIAKKYGSVNVNINENVNINVKILFDLIEPLEKMNKIIGMGNVKTQILDLILTSMQDLYDSKTLFHSIITGPPGVGKTMLAKILGEIYLKLGILKNTEYVFKIARRSDLIGKYLGHTALKTQELIDSCEGGVLFIDEVYSLGNDDKKDSFSKECIDTINLNLTEKENFICIIAGYPEEIESCFFSVNPGLKRRYPFKYEINNYTYEELSEIFLSKLMQAEWKVNVQKEELLDFFKENKKAFQYFGGDIDNLILNCRTCHSKRIFGRNSDLRKIIVFDDIKCGFEKFMNSKTQNKDNEGENVSYKNMYL